MNTWIVGNVPAAHQIINYARSIFDAERGIEKRGEKVFFMKGRILAGQANLEGNGLGWTDYRWLTKEEISEAIAARDWNGIKNVLAER